MTQLNPAQQAAQDAARKAGKFGEQSHSDPGELQLGRPGATMIDIPIHTGYTTQELPSPRHRKLVDVEREFDMVGEIRSIDGEQAPVALEIGEEFGTDNVPLREFDGDLYKPYRPAHRQVEMEPFDTSKLSAALSDSGSSGYYGSISILDSEDDARDFKQNILDHYLVIDGDMWHKAAEPMYYVLTQGFGGGHGGTSLNVESTYNPNIRADHYFRADEWELAKAEAIRVAEQRGDDTDRFRSMQPMITVHNPAAVTATMPVRETEQVQNARSKYREALHTFNRVMSDPLAYGGPGVAQAQNTMQIALAQLTGLTDDVAGLGSLQAPTENRPGTWRTRV